MNTNSSALRSGLDDFEMKGLWFGEKRCLAHVLHFAGIETENLHPLRGEVGRTWSICLQHRSKR